MAGGHRGPLRVPAVLGRPTWNKESTAQYVEVRDGRKVPATEVGTRRVRTEADRIAPAQPIYDPLVPPDQFERVNAYLSGRTHVEDGSAASKTA